MMESPMTKNCHVGFGERYEETHQSQDWEVRFVPTPLNPLLANIAPDWMENEIKCLAESFYMKWSNGTQQCKKNKRKSVSTPDVN